MNTPTTSDFTVETADSCYEWTGELYCASGDYTQTFTGENGCDSTVTLHLTTSVGIPTHMTGANVYLAPNPTQSICRIIGLDSPHCTVNLYDLGGRLIMRDAGTEFNVAILPSGVYLVRIFTDSHVINLKLIKQ